MIRANQYFDTDVWVPVPIVSKEQRAKGHPGGEGCQWPVYITRDQEDGQLAFFSTDVSGLYKSVDGGRNWTPSDTGFRSPSVAGIQIDPNNKNHIVAIGAGSSFHMNGVHLSWDCGETWHHKLRVSAVGSHDERHQTAFDPTTYDEKIGGSAVVYWSRPSVESPGHNHPALYKSVDGGETWKEIPDSAELGDCNIKVHPTKGWLYLAKPTGGLWRSKDKGETFEKLDDEKNLWMDLVKTHPDNLYISTSKGLRVSYDCGDTFTVILGENYPTLNPRFLSVSPANPDDMIVEDDRLWHPIHAYDSVSYYTHDGGKTWHEVELDFTDSFIPQGKKQRPSAWAPDGSDILSFGGDFVMRSENRGELFTVSNDGYNGSCVGTYVGYNINNPKNIYLPNQDYNGAFSNDGGYTWTYVNWSGFGWGGWTYGGYCWNEKECCAGNAKGWSGKPVDGEVEICITRDGGKTIERTGCMCSGVKKCMAVIGDDDTVFFGEWKTTDRGHTWKRLADQDGKRIIDGVMAYDFSSNRLFAVRGGCVLESWDNGETWDEIIEFSTRPGGLSYDHVNEKLYIAMDNNLFVMEKDGTTTLLSAASDNENRIYIKDVYVNPDNVDMIYTTAWNWIDFGIENIFRSLDGGKSWTSLTRTIDGPMQGPPAGKFPDDLYINRDTQEVYASFSCHGLWKMKLPEVES